MKFQKFKSGADTSIGVPMAQDSLANGRQQFVPMKAI